jgi:hypothetical protein
LLVSLSNAFLPRFFARDLGMAQTIARPEKIIAAAARSRAPDRNAS